MKKKKVFIICPVRKPDKETKRKIRQYVKKLEKQGCQVHWPSRDTDQKDPVGLQICKTNSQAILEADEVHIWFDPTSKGSVFDFGVYFALTQIIGYKKKLVVINRIDVLPTDRKSLQNVLLALASE